MKFKFLGLMWDMSLPLGFIWMMWGCMNIGLTFAIPHMSGGAIVLWIISTFIFMMTGESISNKLTNSIGEDNGTNRSEESNSD